MSIAQIQPSANGVPLTLAPQRSSEFDICWSNKHPSAVDPKEIRRWLDPLKKKLPSWVGVRVWIVEKRLAKLDYGYPDVRYNLYVLEHKRPNDEEFNIEKFVGEFAEIAKLHGVDEFRLYLKKDRGWKI